MVIINCSPKGVTGTCAKTHMLLESELLNKGISVKSIDLNNCSKIEHCWDCGYCKRRKGCHIRDEMQMLFEIFNMEEDFVIISPIQFDNVAPMFSIMLSRCNAIYHSKYTLNDSMIDRNKKRRIVLVLVGGSKPYKDQFPHAEHTIKFFARAINAECDESVKIHSTDYEKPNIEEIVNEILEKLKVKK